MGFLKDKPKALHVFRVVTKGHIYLLSCKSASLKQDWMKVCLDCHLSNEVHTAVLRTKLTLDLVIISKPSHGHGVVERENIRGYHLKPISSFET